MARTILTPHLAQEEPEILLAVTETRVVSATRSSLLRGLASLTVENPTFDARQWRADDVDLLQRVIIFLRTHMSHK